MLSAGIAPVVTMHLAALLHLPSLVAGVFRHTLLLTSGIVAELGYVWAGCGGLVERVKSPLGPEITTGPTSMRQKESAAGF